MVMKLKPISENNAKASKESLFSTLKTFSKLTESIVHKAYGFLILGWLLGCGAATVRAQPGSLPAPRPRVLVLTDIGNEPDDAQSLVRFLLYANEFDVEGLLATTSTWLRDSVRTDIIQGHLAAYRDVQDNLSRHAEGYPTAETLLSKTKPCRPVYGMAGVGEGMQSPGSEHIIAVVDSPDPRPVWIPIWGGANCLAQALWEVRRDRSTAAVAAFVKKIRVYTISDQDDAGPWIRRSFPDLFYIVSPSSQGSEDYGKATWVGISGRSFRGSDTTLVDNPWLKENIREGHGPLGARYPATIYIMEGDTPSFLNLIPNGLAAHRSPAFGGWGGRYRLAQPAGETRPIWTNDDDRVTGVDGEVYTSNQATIWRWREAYQHDLAARIDWSAGPERTAANHNPVALLNGTRGTEPLFLDVAPGREIYLSAEGSHDPDSRDTITWTWWVYPEAGTYSGSVSLREEEAEQAIISIPDDAAGTTIHVILEVKDDGTPALRSYRRAVLQVQTREKND